MQIVFCVGKISRLVFMGIIFFMGLFFHDGAVSQNSLHQDVLDTVVLDEELSKKETKFLSGMFTQKKYISVLPNPLLSHGSFIFSKNKASPDLIWTTVDPIKSVLYFDQRGIRQDVDGKTAWNIDADQPAVATLTEVITAVLASDWDTLKNYFDISVLDLSKQEGSQKEKSKQEGSKQEISKQLSQQATNNTVVQLMSRESALKSVVTSMIIVLELVSDKKIVTAELSNVVGAVKQLIMYETNGDRTEIVFLFSGANEQ